MGRSPLEQALGVLATRKLNVANMHVLEDLSWNSVLLSKADVRSRHPKNSRACDWHDNVRPRATGSVKQGTIL